MQRALIEKKSNVSDAQSMKSRNRAARRDADFVFSRSKLICNCEIELKKESEKNANQILASTSVASEPLSWTRNLDL